jgi:phytoene synthase
VPQARRRHLLALYAFDIETARVQHLVHEPMAGMIRLQWWREALLGERVEEAAGHPVIAALKSALQETGADVSPLLAAIEARERELQGEPAVAAASAIFLTAARMLGAEGEAVRVAADHAGAAQIFADDPSTAEKARQACIEFRAMLDGIPKDALPAFLPVALIPLRLRRRDAPQWRKQLALLRAAYFGFPRP